MFTEKPGVYTTSQPMEFLQAKLNTPTKFQARQFKIPENSTLI